MAHAVVEKGACPEGGVFGSLPILYGSRVVWVEHGHSVYLTTFFMSFFGVCVLGLTRRQSFQFEQSCSGAGMELAVILLLKFCL